MRMTIDFHDNELKMSAYLSDKYAEILQKMGAAQIVKQPRTTLPTIRHRISAAAPSWATIRATVP
jgi:hypothetical protein